MRRIIATEFVTLDGVIETPDQWSMPFWNDQATKYKHEELFATDALLLGRKTYEEFAEAWPAMSDNDVSEEIGRAVEPEDITGFADRMNSLPKYVVSTTLKEPLAWNNSTLVDGDVVEALTSLKQEPGQDIAIHGSAELINSLMEHDLIDEYRLMVFPVVAGQGKRLFHEGRNKPLELVDSRTFETGVVVLTYAPVEAEAER